MTAHLHTTLLTLLIASPILIWAAVAWRQASAQVDDAWRVPGTDWHLCRCGQIATQPHPDEPDRSVCIDCWMMLTDLRELAAGIVTVPGGVRSLCVSCGDPDDDLLTHPDGGAGGLCHPCHTALTDDLGGH